MIKINGTSGITNVDGTAASPALTGADTDTGVFTGTDIVGISTGGTERVRVNASGNVGIGTSSPASRLGVTGANTAMASEGLVRLGADANGADIGAQITFGNDTARRAAIAGRQEGASGAAGYLQFGTRGTSGDITERARIDSSGNLLVGTTDTGFNARQLIRFEASGASTNGLAIWNGGGSGALFTAFANSSGGFVGSITQSGTSAVAYNTSSDYRLKHDIQPMTGALAKVALLKPVTYKWNADDSQSQGFIAHELQEVVPECVTGEKDAVDADGKPVYQGIDTSFLVATLTAAIKELKSELDVAKARIEQLEQA